MSHYHDKKATRLGGLLLAGCKALLCALDFASLHALGADVGLAHMTLAIADGDLLDVRAEHAVGHTVRMGHATTGNRLLTADFADLRHFTLSNSDYLNGPSGPPLSIKPKHYITRRREFPRISRGKPR